MNYLQKCPQCKDSLEPSAFPKSHQGKNGKACSSCHYKRQRKAFLKRQYGLESEDLDKLLARQRNRCLGCLKDLTDGYDVDHNHVTNKVRGLLCRHCNLILGLAKEDKARLTRLRLYLDRDPDQTNVYIIGSLRNPGIPDVSNKLRELGFVVWDEWVAAGPEADDYWQKYAKGKGLSYQDALHGLCAQNVFYFDRGLIDLADIGVLVMPAGKSGHLELGYMAAQGKQTYILHQDEPERFDVMPQFATGVFDKLEDLIECLKSSA